MKISQTLLDELVEHAEKEAPNECCGLIEADGDQAVAVHRARNMKPSPLHYEIDGADLVRIELAIDDNGRRLGAFYHSHTRTAPFPSETDINLASPLYPDSLYVIVGVARPEPEVRAFRIADGEVSEQPLEID